MLAHLKKIYALLSACDALQMSQELTESLIEALLDRQEYPDDMGPPSRVACLPTISFLDEESMRILKVAMCLSSSREYSGTSPLLS